MKDIFTTVLVVSYAHETATIVSLLESEGIECNLKDEIIVEMNPLYSNAIGGIKIQVRESEREKALSVLREGGYLQDRNTENDGSPSFIERFTSNIPFIRKLDISYRLAFLMFLLAFAMGVCVFFLTSI